jgi:large repetitive protein
MKKFLLGFAGAVAAIAIQAQSFTEQATSFGVGVTAVKDGGLCFADFNEDGFPDLVVNTQDNAVSTVLLFSNGGAGFTDVTATHTNGLASTLKDRSAIAGDFNNDGHMDFAVNSFNRLEIWINKGPSATPAYSFGTVSGAPNQVISSLTGGMNSEGVVTADYDSDGDLDIIFDSHAFGVDVLSNNGSGVFSQVDNALTGFPTAGTGGDYGAVGDYDNDGFVDVIFRRDSELSLYHNNGNGTFSAVPSLTANTSNSNKGSVLFADFDNDSDLDIFWTDNGVNQIWRNNSGTWSATGLPTVSGSPVPNGIDGASAADVDNDGDIDIYLGNTFASGFLFINNDPAALSFTRTNLGINPNDNTEGLSFVDIDADGDQDLYININDASNGNQLWVNDLNNGNYLVVQPYWNAAGMTLANGATAELLDCSGNVISGLRNIGSGEGHGCFGATSFHFGVADPAETYFVRVYYPQRNGNRTVVVREVVPNAEPNQTIVVRSTDPTVTPGGCPGLPVAANDSYDVATGDVLSGNVGDNDSDTTGDPLVYSLVDGGSAAANGTLVFNADGSFTFATTNTGPVAYTFIYELCNSTECAEATVTINVLDDNEAPIADDDFFTTDEDVALLDDVAVNDSDPNGDLLSFNLITPAANGSVVLNNDGTFTYTPDADFNGTDTFEYEACDGQVCTQAVATITVNPINDAPLATNDFYDVPFETPFTENVLSNDNDVDGDVLTIGIVTGPISGILSIDLDGTFTYTPDAGFFGTDSFTYEVCDVDVCTTGTATFNVSGTNLPPVAEDDDFTIDEDNALLADVSINDSDPENDALTFSAVTLPGNGTLVINPDGTFEYTPAADFFGTDFFTYEACDGVECSVAGVTITVNAENDAPIAQDDNYTTAQDTPVTANVFDNDTDVDGDVLIIGLTTNTTNGSLSIDVDGTFTYIPDSGFSGSDSFTYEACDGEVCVQATVTINVTGQNEAPVAQDDVESVDEDQVLIGDVSSNDSDPDGDALTYTLLTDVVNGTLVLNIDGTFTYTPDADFNGTDSFVYEVCDASLCATAGVTITVNAINDAPQGETDNYTTALETSITENVLANDNDVDGDVLEVCGNTIPANGLLSIDNDGTFTYTPSAGFTGIDSFTYDVCDGQAAPVVVTVNIQVTDANTPPVAEDDAFNTDEDNALSEDVSTNDTDAEGDALSYSLLAQATNGVVVMNADGTFTYTPDADFNGTDSFVYEVCDAEECATAGVTITVNAINDVPVADDDVYTTATDIPVTDNVLANDSDVDGDVLEVCGNTNPSNGTLSIDTDGTFTYIPDAGFSGTDSFTYDVCDGTAAPQTVTVTINVQTVNTPPQAEDDNFTTDEDTVLNASVAANDTDTDGDALTFDLVSSTSNGTLVFNTDGTFAYTPGNNFIGFDTFIYEACDGTDCTVAGVTIEVTPVNDAPDGNADAYSTNVDQPITDNVLANDTDADNDVLSVCGNTAPSNGTLSIDIDGTFTYIPNTGFEGTDSFTYEVCDGTAAPVSVVVIINVIGENVPPIAEDDFFTTNEETAISSSVATNDSDPNGDVLTFTLLQQPANGTLVFNANGTFVYTPNNDFIGFDTFIYEACDATDCTVAGVTIEVLPLNDAPNGVADNYSTGVDVPVTENVLANDTDADNDVLSVCGNTLPANGSLSIDIDGTFTYIPNSGFEGSDSFTYDLCDGTAAPVTVLVTINVIGENVPPVAEDDFFTTNEDTPLTASVTGNDSDPNGDALTYTLVQSTSNGTLVFNADGSFTYTPDNNFIGFDTFLYEACDAEFCTQAGVTIEVVPVNDAPNGAADNYSTGVDVPITENVLANDTDADNDVLSICGNTLPSNGSLSIDLDGTFTYIPNSGFEGSDSFTYDVCDGTAAPVTVLVTINVIGENVPPVAEDDFFTTNEDIALTASVTANDSDPNGDALTYSLVQTTGNGTLVFNADGSFTYTPDNNFIGFDTFLYEACDAEFCTQAGVTIEVLPVNDAPIGNDDFYTTGIDQPVTENVLANDIDADNDVLSICGNTDPANGTVSIDIDGTFTYIPNAGFEGEDSFTYNVCDGTAAPVTVTVFINVIGEDLPPVAEDDAFTINEDEVLNASVAVNDTEPNGQDLTFNLVSTVGNGTLVFNADGTFTYTPDADWYGTDFFVYEACDGTFCTEAGVTITVVPVNDAPVAEDDFYVTLEGEPITDNVLANDSDVDNDVLTIDSFTQTSNGTVSVDADGTFTYIPNPGYFGVDSFTYTVCDGNGECVTATVFINVVDVNLPPIAVDDDFTMNEDEVLNGSVAGNDSDPEGGSLTFNLLTDVTNGTLVFNADGSFTYTPDANFNGTDTFTYEACDGFGLCDDAVVIITVLPVLDLVICADDVYTMNEDEVLNENVSTNDINVDNLDLTYTLVTGVSNGTLVLNADGTFTYTPDVNWNGQDTFVYEACDSFGNCDQATVTITVLPVNDSPLAVDDVYTIDEDTSLSADVSLNDSDVDGDDLTFTLLTGPANGTAIIDSDGLLDYTPNANFNGTDSLSYLVCDVNNACDTGWVFITVNPIDDPVEAVDDTYSVDEDGVLNENVGSNDIDVDGDDLTFTLVTDVTNGTLVFNADGTFTYTPNPDFSGTDTFVYELCDQVGNCDEATVTITVVPVNDAPIAVDDEYTTDEDTVLNGDVGVNDSDTDSADLTFTLVTDATNGTVVLNADGTFTYTPDANFNGTDTFVYEVCDDLGACDQATVTINVVPVNDAPDAVDDEYTTNVNTPISGNVTDNDVEVDGDELTVTLVTDVTNGTLVLNSDGTFTYTPDTDFIGTDSFVYEVCDPSGLCDQATVVINVIDNLPPVASDDAFTVNEDEVLDATVAGNDTDPNGDVLSYTVLTAPINGTLVVNANGTFTYTPDADFNGTDSFTYVVCDEEALCDTANVVITVVPVNDAPVAEDDTYTTVEATAVSGNVLDNDTDVDGDDLGVTLVTDVTNGTLVLNADGTFTYTPDAGFVGTDTFVYEVCDGSGLCDQATVTITVTAGPGDVVCVDDQFTTTEDVPLSGDVSTNDTDGLTFTLFDDVVNGTLVFNADGTFTYTPDGNFHGTDIFVYVGCDVNNVCDTADVEIVVNPVNDAPSDEDENIELCQGVGATIDVLANASDVDGDDLAPIITNVTVGSATINANNEIVYVADPNFSGTVVITYQVCDDAVPSVCVTSTVTIVYKPASLNVESVIDNVACFGDDDGSIALTVEGGIGPYAYDWSNDSTTASISGLVTGQYAVTVSDLSNCAQPFTASYEVTAPAELVVTTLLDFDACIDETANISSSATGGTAPYVFTWEGTVNGSDLINAAPGATYELTVGDANGCVVTTEVEVNAIDAECFFVPDGFSPDGNGRNDVFVIRGLNKYPGNTVTIFNRWGNKVFEATDYQNDWNGTANTGGVVGEKVQPGTYFYVIDLNNDEDPKTGDLTIKY